MILLLFFIRIRILIRRERHLGADFHAEIRRREAEEPRIDDLVAYIEGDTIPLTTTASGSNNKKNRKKTNKSDQISLTDPVNAVREDKLKETGAIPKKTNQHTCEDDKTSNSALEADHDEIKQPKPALRLINYLLKSISEKEAELECPVCLRVVEAGAAIFSCQQQHLLCSDCRPRVRQCPQCREKYSEPPLRHRFAEKMARELQAQRHELAAQLEQLD